MSFQQRPRLGLLANRIESNEIQTDEDREYVSATLRQLAEGQEADAVFGLNKKPGEKDINNIKRQNLARMFHWMQGAMEKAPDGFGLNASQAIEAASALSNNEPYRCREKDCVLESQEQNLFQPISPDNLRKAWYNKNFAGLKKTEISSSDWDFPYDDWSRNSSS